MKLTKTIMQKEGTVNLKQTHTHAILKGLKTNTGTNAQRKVFNWYKR